MFSIVYDERLNRYKVKQTAILKEAERMNIYGTYTTMFEAKKVLKGLASSKKDKLGTQTEGKAGRK